MKISLYIYVLLFVFLPKFLLAIEKSGSFHCSANKARAEDLFIINLPMIHGSDLAIVNPDGEYFFIAFSQPDSKSKLKPVISEREFRESKSISQKISEYKGVSWGPRNNLKPTKIFVKHGKYIVKLSKALETEDPILDGECAVEYLP